MTISPIYQLRVGVHRDPRKKGVYSSEIERGVQRIPAVYFCGGGARYPGAKYAGLSIG